MGKLDREALNQRLAEGSGGERFVPRITERQLAAIELALSSSHTRIDSARLSDYVSRGDLDRLTKGERDTLAELSRRAKGHATSTDDAKRIWPRKVAVVLEALG